MSKPKQVKPVTTSVTTPESTQKIQIASEGQTDKGQHVGGNTKEGYSTKSSVLHPPLPAEIRNYFAQVYFCCPLL